MKKIFIVSTLVFVLITALSYAETTRLLDTALSTDIHTGLKIGTTGNLVELNGDGITLSGSKMVIRKQEINLTKMKLGVGNPPAEGLLDGFPTLDFDDTTDEETFSDFGSPSAWAAIADADFKIRFFVDTAPVGAANIVWAMEYKSIASDGIYDFSSGTSTVTDIVAITTGTPANDQKIHEAEIIIPNAGLIADGQLLVRIYRDANHVSDTFTGDARLFRPYIEFLSDKMGEAQ